MFFATILKEIMRPVSQLTLKVPRSCGDTFVSSKTE